MLGRDELEAFFLDEEVIDDDGIGVGEDMRFLGSGMRVCFWEEVLLDIGAPGGEDDGFRFGFDEVEGSGINPMDMDEVDGVSGVDFLQSE